MPTASVNKQKLLAIYADFKRRNSNGSGRVFTFKQVVEMHGLPHHKSVIKMRGLRRRLYEYFPKINKEELL